MTDAKQPKFFTEALETVPGPECKTVRRARATLSGPGKQSEAEIPNEALADTDDGIYATGGRYEE